VLQAAMLAARTIINATRVFFILAMFSISFRIGGSAGGTWTQRYKVAVFQRCRLPFVIADTLDQL
jgi:hypothetical protein